MTTGTETTTKRLRIYGTRECPVCKGICHEGSWRKRRGKRRRYYCSDSCMETKTGGPALWGSDWDWYRSLYERVKLASVPALTALADVISR